MNSESIPLSAWDTLKLTNSSLFILNSDVMRHPVFCLAALPLAFHMWFIRAMRLTQDWLYFELCLTQFGCPTPFHSFVTICSWEEDTEISKQLCLWKQLTRLGFRGSSPTEHFELDCISIHCALWWVSEQVVGFLQPP